MALNSPNQNKTWAVGPYGMGEWAMIFHAPDRSHARAMGLRVDPFYEFIDMRAIRLPKLDGRLITRDLLIECGFPIGESDEFYTENAYDAVAEYVAECKCDLCKRSLEALK